MKRDLRIDFLRGIVLLLIVLDHGRDNPVHKMFADGSKSITAIVTCWGYCDAAHAFIFLSGLVCGMVYWRLMLRQGAPAAVKKAFKRVGQLYAMHLTTLAVCAGIVFLAHASGKLDPVKVGMGPFVTEPVKAGVNALMLTYTPWLMDILKMYIILLLMLPVMLMVYRWRRWVAIGLSCAMYVFAQRCSDVVLPVYPQGQQWFWNPLAWQLLFFGGVWL
ncbi:MAG TPA: OpgC domain-containing protein, partial [Phycisphaerales bacterium]|nr:OpgC domain-containing protein [Phycisphaerales bacterium]